MCRIVLYVLDQPINPRPENARRQSHYLPGDVVRIVEDGVFLGADVERGYPKEYPSKVWWRVVELPGIPANDPDLVPLLARDGAVMTDLGFRSFKRSRHIDLTKLKNGRLGKADVVAAISSKPSQPQSGVIE